MHSVNKHLKSLQRSMKDYTSPSTKSNKRYLSPTEDKQLKKTKYFTKMSKETPTIGPTIMDMVTGNASMQMDELDKLGKSYIPNVSTTNEDQLLTSEKPDTKLEGALGPLVQQIKLLRKSFDEKYS